MVPICDQVDCRLPVRVLDFCCQCRWKECYPGDSGSHNVRVEMLIHQIDGKKYVGVQSWKAKYAITNFGYSSGTEGKSRHEKN